MSQETHSLLRFFAPFALGGVAIAMILMAAVPRESRGAASGRAADAKAAAETGAVTGVDVPFAPEYVERHALTPRALQKSAAARVEFEDVHAMKAPRKKAASR